MSHVHFTSTEGARSRVIALGEEPWRVHRAGAPSLDHLRRRALLSRDEIESRLGISLQTPPVLVGYHPVTLARDTLYEADALFAALAEVDGPVVFCIPTPTRAAATSSVGPGRSPRAARDRRSS